MRRRPRRKGKSEGIKAGGGDPEGGGERGRGRPRVENAMLIGGHLEHIIILWGCTI